MSKKNMKFHKSLGLKGSIIGLNFRKSNDVVFHTTRIRKKKNVIIEIGKKIVIRFNT